MNSMESITRTVGAYTISDDPGRLDFALCIRICAAGTW
jgi:hypothetical protein